MAIIFVSVPPGDITHPPLPLASTTAVLRNAGYRVIQRDLNIEACHAFLQPKRLKRVKEKLEDALFDLDRRGSLRFSEGLQYLRFLKTLAKAPSILEEIEWAVETLKNRSTYRNYDAYLRASRMIRDAFDLLSSEFDPVRFSASGSSFLYRSFRLYNLLTDMGKRISNPFRSFFRDSVLPDLWGMQPPEILGIAITCQDLDHPASCRAV